MKLQMYSVSKISIDLRRCFGQFKFKVLTVEYFAVNKAFLKTMVQMQKHLNLGCSKMGFEPNILTGL